MVNIENSMAMNDVSINIAQRSQSVEIIQEPSQAISIDNTGMLQDIPVDQDDAPQEIKISVVSSGASNEELKIAIDSKVPKTLSVLPQATSGQFAMEGLRSLVRLYVDVNGIAHYATLEQLKRLNTKTIFVDALNDSKINTLSNDDIIMLKEG